MKLGFQIISSELTLYKKVSGDLDLLLICLYVVDIICMGSSIIMVNEFKSDVMHTFKIIDLGLL